MDGVGGCGGGGGRLLARWDGVVRSGKGRPELGVVGVGGGERERLDEAGEDGREGGARREEDGVEGTTSG